MFVQSHTPFADMDHLKDKTVMVVGGEADKCRAVAEAYGYGKMQLWILYPHTEAVQI